LKRKFALGILLITSMLTLAFRIETVYAADYPSVFVDPEYTHDHSLTPDSTYIVSIMTDYTGDDITSYQFSLTWDPYVLECMEVANGEIVTGGAAYFQAGPIDNVAGTLGKTGALFFNPADVASGPGVLANVTFGVVGIGKSNITLGSVQLVGWNATGVPSPHAYLIVDGATMLDHIGHGFFSNVKPIHDVAVISLVVPATVVIGQLVSNINVKVANEGNFTETFNVKVYTNTTLIETQTSITITSGDRTTLTFNWNTTDLTEGNYTITAEAILVGDADLTNNHASTTIRVYKGMELKYRTPELLEEGFIYVLVEPSIFDGIEASLKRYAMDVERSNFSVGIYTVLTNNTASIRGFLQATLPKGLVGCLLIGNVPEAYYESNEWGTYPTDLYYMDLDGVWSDTDGDGVYDEHHGERGLEIWVGTLHSSLVSGDNIELLNNYFEKNHLYRTGKLTLPKRALIYIDDPWALEGEWMANATRIAYDETTLVNDPEITTAWDYQERLLEGYEWISLMCHGWDSSHTFMHHGGEDGGLTGLDYRSIDPHTFFYVLYTCYSASGYDNLASSFVFTDTYGLVAFASRGIGVFLGSPEFYEALSDGKCIGEARLECTSVKFYEIWPAEFDIPGYEYYWTIVGDPSLHIHGYPDTAPPVANAGPDQVVHVGETVTFNGSGSLDNVGIVSYEWDFGDETNGTGMTTTHTYTTEGTYIVTLTVWDAAGNNNTDTMTVTATISSPVIAATIDINPGTLNLRSKGKWITCHIELPEGYDVSDIDVSTVMLDGEIQAELHPTEI
jgi:hypothetical protein